jgi:hypothetical protein
MPAKSDEEAWAELDRFLEKEDKKRAEQEVKKNRIYILILFGIFFVVLFFPLVFLGIFFLFLFLLLSQPILILILVIFERKKILILSKHSKRILHSLWIGAFVTLFLVAFFYIRDPKIDYSYLIAWIIFVFPISTIILYLLSNLGIFDKLFEWRKIEV